MQKFKNKCNLYLTLNVKCTILISYRKEVKSILDINKAKQKWLEHVTHKREESKGTIHSDYIIITDRTEEVLKKAIESINSKCKQALEKLNNSCYPPEFTVIEVDNNMGLIGYVLEEK